jgi:hypothetical protein
VHIYVTVAFTITTVILTNIAYPTNTTHAGNVTSEPQPSPKVDPIYKARTHSFQTQTASTQRQHIWCWTNDPLAVGV